MPRRTEVDAAVLVEVHMAGILTEDNGNPSCMRLMCLAACLGGIND